MADRQPGWARTYWPIWLLAVALSFAVPEGVALAAGEGTLSEWTRDAIGTTHGQATAGWWAVTGLLAAFAVWFSAHLRHLWWFETPPEDGG